MCFFGGDCETAGVSYKMLETAAAAPYEGPVSATGRGNGDRLCKALYASALVEFVLLLHLICPANFEHDEGDACVTRCNSSRDIWRLAMAK